MKLRARFPRLQLLFLLGYLHPHLGAGTVRADWVTTIDGRRQEAKVMGVVNGQLQVQLAMGLIGIPLSSVKDVQMPVPAEFPKALQAVNGKDFPGALRIIRPLADKYKGIPAEWAQQCTSMLGDLYLATGELANAESAYRDFQKFYPSAGSLQVDVGMARVAISKKQFESAKSKIDPIAENALKDKNVSRSNSFAYSQAFLARGEIKENQGDLSGALEDYLRTVTLFYNDPSAVSIAQQKAEALQAKKVSVP